MSKIIKFTHQKGIDLYPPKPSINSIPEWYKMMSEYMNGKKEVDENQSLATIKKCIPVFDAMTAGYIMFTQVDIYVKSVNDMPHYSWASQEAITWHPVEQADKHPSKNGFPYPKWTNYYGIETLVYLYHHCIIQMIFLQFFLDWLIQILILIQLIFHLF